MKTLRKCVLIISLMVSTGAAHASIITGDDIDFGNSSLSMGDGWSVASHERLSELFDQTRWTGVDIDRDLSCTAQWLGWCVERGDRLSDVPVVFDLAFHEAWDITSHGSINHNIKYSQFEFVDASNILVQWIDNSFDDVMRAKFVVTDSTGYWDHGFRVKEIELHGEKSQVEVSAPATLGLLSLGSMLLLRRRA